MAEDDTQTTSNTADSKIPKHRSPNYPFIGLEDALARLAQVNELGRGHFVPIRTAREKWGYQQNTGDRTVAALKAYGLVDVTGESEKRQLKPTESGSKVLENHSQKNALIEEAALMPALHNEIWAKYSGNLPDDSVIREFLRWDKKFNPENIDKFLKQFRDTITFANLSESDKIDNSGGISDDDERTSTNRGNGNGESKSKTPVLNKNVIFNIIIDVLENGQINITNGGSLTSDTFSILSDVFKLKEKHEKQPLPNESDKDLAGWSDDQI